MSKILAFRCLESKWGQNLPDILTLWRDDELSRYFQACTPHRTPTPRAPHRTPTPRMERLLEWRLDKSFDWCDLVKGFLEYQLGSINRWFIFIYLFDRLLCKAVVINTTEWLLPHQDFDDGRGLPQKLLLHNSSYYTSVFVVYI